MFAHRRLLAVACLTVAALCAFSRADPGRVFARHEANGWVFTPGYISGEVRVMLAWAKEPGATWASNTVLFQRNAEGGWDSAGWTDATHAEAASYVRVALGDESLFSQDGGLDVEALLASPAPEPASMTAGFYADDLVGAAVMSVPNPRPLLSILEQAEWPSAPNVSALHTEPAPGDACEFTDVFPMPTSALVGDDLLNAIAARLSDADGAAALLWPCAGCTYTYGPATPTPPGTWAFNAATPTPVGGRYPCRYERPATAPSTAAGLTVWRCCTCTPGVPAAPGYEFTIFDSDTPCPTAPPANPPANFMPN